MHMLAMLALTILRSNSVAYLHAVREYACRDEGVEHHGQG